MKLRLGRTRTRYLLFAALLAAYSAAVCVDSAVAHVQATRHYCTNIEITGDTWCQGGGYALFHENRGSTYQGRCVGVRFVRVSDNAVLYRYMAPNFVSSGYRDASLRWAQVANCSNTSWTFSGNADYHYP